MAGRNHSYTGSSVPRQEDERLLRGLATFIDDIPEPVGTVYLAFLRSPHPHARIQSIDIRAAKAYPGVIRVLIGEDIAALTKPMETPTLKGQPPVIRPNMAVGIVRYVGEAVAAVVADDPYRAEDAAELIDVSYEPLQAVLTPEDALAPDAPLIHDYLPSNRIFHLKHDVAGTEEVFAGATHVMTERFDSERISAVAMEPRGFLTHFDHGTNKLKHYSSAQLPHIMRRDLAAALEMRESDVQVIAPHVGGSFGMKSNTFPEDVVGAVVARETGRPTKWLQDRQDDLALMHARDFHFEVDIAFENDGTILGIRNRVVVNIGAYPIWVSTAGIDAGGAGHHMMGPYRVKYYSYDVSSIVSHKAPTASYRGVAAPMCFLAVESLMERIAAKLGIDPVELRRRNLISREDLPYRNAVGLMHDTATHLECLDRALALVGYDEFRRKHTGKLEPDGKYRGIGVAVVTDHTGQGTSIARSRGQSSGLPGFDGATIRMEPDGNVRAYVSFASQGQGHATVFAQIIADQLGLSMNSVTVEQGDTATMPLGTGTGASRGAVAGSGAVIKASTKIAGKLRRIGAYLLEASPEDIVLGGGKASVNGVPELSVDMATIAATAYLIGPNNMPQGETIGIDATEYFDPSSSVYSNATHAVCVAIEAETGHVTIEKYVVVHDCGTILNPMIVHGQLTGAIVQGVGSVLTERMQFSEEGQPVATTLLDYLIPTFLDVPKIEVDHMTSLATTNPMGAKGAGEGGIVGAVPAIVLALSDALTQFKPNFNKIPIMPTQLLELMQARDPV